MATPASSEPRLGRPPTQKSRIGKSPTRLPNYKPVPLRWPFLAALFLYICVLIALLEYGFRVLPVVQDRMSGFRPQRPSSHTTAQTTAPATLTTGTPGRRKRSTLPKHVSATPTPETASGSSSTLGPPTSPGNDGSTAVASGTSEARPTPTRRPTSTTEEPYVRPTSFPAWIYQRPNHSSWDWLDRQATGRILMANRRDPDRYAMLGPDYVLAHYVLAFEWTHGPANILKTPVPPGTDVSDRCVKHDVMGWITHNPDDCPVLIPLNVWNGDQFSGAFGPIGGGDAFLDMDCRKYDNDQVVLLDAYWNEPECWASEVAARTIYHLPKTADPNEVVVVTRVVTGLNGPVTLVEQTTLGGDVATVAFDSSRVITTTRRRGDANPVPGVVNTLTDSLGRPTATTTSFPFGFTQRATSVTLRDSAGRPTATTLAYEPLGTRLVTLNDEHGAPTATLTEYFRERPTSVFPSRPGPHRPLGDYVLYAPLSYADYFAGSFVPVLLSTLLAILVKTLHANLQSLLPFHALTRAGGAAAADSLYLAPGGIRGLLTSWRLLYRFGEPVSLLSDALWFLSVLFVSLSSEAVGVTFVGDCSADSFYNCFLNLAIVSGPARAAEAVMVAMAVLVAAVCFLLCRWRTGVAASPWSIVNVASLLPPGGETLRLLRSLDPTQRKNSKLLKDELSDVTFALDCYPGGNGDADGAYGIVAGSDGRLPRLPAKTDPSSRLSIPEQHENQSFSRRPWVLKLVGRLAFLGILCGFLTVITLYETATTTDAFERFMNGQNFGSSFLFTGLGLIIDYFWDEFYFWTTMLEPYRRLAVRPQPAEASILIPRATTALTGVWQAVILRNVFGGAVATVSVLSKFTPIFLANIPFKLTLTWTMHSVCTWLSVAILTTMALVLITSFFTKWPSVPAEPSTIAGCIYYVRESEMLRDFEGMSLMSQREREKRLRVKGRKYHLLEIVGGSGETRVGIDYASKLEI